jgi:hypothetical protein
VKLRKACGLDGIPNECLRNLPRRPLVHLTHLFNYYFPLSISLLYCGYFRPKYQGAQSRSTPPPQLKKTVICPVGLWNMTKHLSQDSLMRFEPSTSHIRIRGVTVWASFWVLRCQSFFFMTQDTQQRTSVGPVQVQRVTKSACMWEIPGSRNMDVNQNFTIYILFVSWFI